MTGAEFDPILEARLDLLKQVLDEVEAIRRAMTDQKRRLKVVEDFLKTGGDLHRKRVDVLAKVRDAMTRIDSAYETNADDDTEQALEALSAAEPLLDKELNEVRKKAYEEFLGLKEWSVAALDDTQLGTAIELYRRSLREIRESDRPWAKYEEQMRSRGEQLYGAYLELLGSIAVRGLGIVDDLASDRKALLELLLTPLGSTVSRPRLSVPNLLTRSEHVQLGYLQWSLWALPLTGREAGLYLIREHAFNTSIPEHQQVVCADTYAAYTLGTSYVAAALFLELDPDGESVGAAASDPARAKLLLNLLPDLAPEPQRETVTQHRDQLRAAWQQAREAIGAPEVVENVVDLEITRRFLDELRMGFPEVAYDLTTLGGRADEAELFRTGQEIAGVGKAWDVLVSMWWARVSHPNACKIIDTSARAAMAGTPVTPGLRSPARPATVVPGRTRHDKPVV